MLRLFNRKINPLQVHVLIKKLLLHTKPKLNQRAIMIETGQAGW